MRISDWSSDVCSSDLQARNAVGAELAEDRLRAQIFKEGSHRGAFFADQIGRPVTRLGGAGDDLVGLRDDRSGFAVLTIHALRHDQRGIAGQTRARKSVV